ncbi:hypothetical protein GGI20_001592 [Coemansia sp. BCRC 34301]|nr:hypothetical protein GGI20_001592 [Coemansia sp. BCRC 34301]
MNELVRGRASGSINSSTSRRVVSAKVLSTMALSETKRMARAHSAAIHSISIDTTEHRYLLSAGTDMSIQLYDLNSFEQTATCDRQVAPTSQVAAAHPRLISCIEWYPVDRGMFTTSSFDHTLRVWDAESMAEACQFSLESRVFGHCMSSTGAHALIAAADESAYIRLCDLRTGSSAQSLLAHHSGCMAAAWSPTQPFVLASGGIDGTLRLWDIRRADSQVCSFGQLHEAGPGDSQAHGGSVCSVLFTGDGSRIASMESTGTVCVWDSERPESPAVECRLGSVAKRSGNTMSGALQMALTTAATRYAADYEMLFCPSGSSIAAVDIATGKRIASLDSHFAPALCAAWRPDHLELYSSGVDGNVLIWCPPAVEELSDEQRNIRRDTWSSDESQ